MRMVDLIEKKKHGQELSEEEIHDIIQGYVANQIPDYQMSAFMMATYFQGMSEKETAILTSEMMHSGDTMDLSGIQGIRLINIQQVALAIRLHLLLDQWLQRVGRRWLK